MIKSGKAAKKALSEVYDHLCFFLNDGRVLKSLKDLGKALKQMPSDVYKHHVNKHKNDFANWVNDVFGDDKLAKELKNFPKTKTAKIIAKRIKELEKLMKKKSKKPAKKIKKKIKKIAKKKTVKKLKKKTKKAVRKKKK